MTIFEAWPKIAIDPATDSLHIYAMSQPEPQDLTAYVVATAPPQPAADFAARLIAKGRPVLIRDGFLFFVPGASSMILGQRLDEHGSVHPYEFQQLAELPIPRTLAAFISGALTVPLQP